MVTKLRRWGPLSEKQSAFLVTLHEKYLRNVELAKSVSLPAGRAVLEGTIVSFKEIEGFRGAATFKLVLDLGNGTRVWGTCPSALEPLLRPNYSSPLSDAIGKRVRFSASVKTSDRDPLFGFFSRPTKPELVSTETASHRA